MQLVRPKWPFKKPLFTWNQTFTVFRVPSLTFFIMNVEKIQLLTITFLQKNNTYYHQLLQTAKYPLKAEQLHHSHKLIQKKYPKIFSNEIFLDNFFKFFQIIIFLLQ